MDRLLTWPAVLETLLEGEDLAIRQAEWAMSEVVAGSATTASLVFDTPQLAVTPGQAVVFYEGDDVVGGGWID